MALVKRVAVGAGLLGLTGGVAVGSAAAHANARDSVASADTAAAFAYQCDSNVNKDCIHINGGANTGPGQRFIVFDSVGNPIVSAAAGGIGVYGDRVGANSYLFGPVVGLDAAIATPSLWYAAVPGGVGTGTHMYFGKTGAPTMNCAMGDTYWRVDTPAVFHQSLYVCKSTNSWVGRV